MYTHLISAEQLQPLLASPASCLVFDCSFNLGQPDAGAADYAQAHIPGAVYAHLDHALSAKPGLHETASGGRHPLPSRERFASWLASEGLSNDMQAVVYDRNGANYCGRLWWMLKWAGHEAVAVLDGGLQAWQATGGAVTGGQESARAPALFALKEARARLLDASAVAAGLGRPGQTLLDARATPRFKGEVEPLDPVAGHIPGALNRPFSLNLGADGKF